MLIQVVSPPLQARPGPCYPPECRDGGTAGWSTLVLTSGSCHHHLEGCYSCLAGVYGEGVWDFGSNSCSQTWSSYLHLAGIHNILYRNLERTAWKLTQQLLNTTKWTVTGKQGPFFLLFLRLFYYYPSTSGRNDNPTASMPLLCFCKSQKRNNGASTFSLSTQQFSCDPSASHTSEKNAWKKPEVQTKCHAGTRLLHILPSSVCWQIKRDQRERISSLAMWNEYLDVCCVTARKTSNIAAKCIWHLRAFNSWY